jgi:ribosomal protein L19E
MQGDREVTMQARKEYPHLKGEMLVRNGRIREDWESNLTLDKYVNEKRQEEKEMWLHVIRKWTQDLKKMKVLLAEEDGLGLLS